MGVFRAEEERVVRELLAQMERPVELLLTLGPAEVTLVGAQDVDISAEARRLVEGVAELGELVSARVVEDAPEERYPALAVLPDGEDAGVRYYGVPWGYEVTSLVHACVEAGRREPSLKTETLTALDALERDVAIDVFVTPT